MRRKPPSRGSLDNNNCVSATPKGKKNGREEDPGEYSNKFFLSVFSGASDEEGRDVILPYGMVTNTHVMSWSWHSQSLRHVPRPKNIISSHSGIVDAFVAASLCLAVSPCCSFVLVVESVRQALFNPSLLFIQKEKKNLFVPGWCLHAFETPLLRCRAVCLSCPSQKHERKTS